MFRNPATPKLIMYVLGSVFLFPSLYQVFMHGKQDEFAALMESIRDGSAAEEHGLSGDLTVAALGPVPILLIFYAGLGSMQLSQSHGQGLVSRFFALNARVVAFMFPMLFMLVLWLVVICCLESYKGYLPQLVRSLALLPFAFLAGAPVAYLQTRILGEKPFFCWTLAWLNTVGLYVAQLVTWMVIAFYFTNRLDQHSLMVRLLPFVFPICHLGSTIPYLIRRMVKTAQAAVDPNDGGGEIFLIVEEIPVDMGSRFFEPQPCDSSRHAD